MKKLIAALLLWPALAFGEFITRSDCGTAPAPVPQGTVCLQTSTTGGRTAGREYRCTAASAGSCTTWVDIVSFPSDPTNCSAGNYPLGIDANGNVQNCTSASAGSVTSVGLLGTANQITVSGTSPITSSGSWTLSIPTNPTLPGTTTGTFSGNLTGNVTGNASTATALAANPTNCSAGNYPLGVDAQGNVENCTAAATGPVTQVNTTAPIAGGPITTTGTITCNVASGSQAGCLASADFTTFNNKVSTTRSLTIAGTANQIT